MDDKFLFLIDKNINKIKLNEILYSTNIDTLNYDMIEFNDNIDIINNYDLIIIFGDSIKNSIDVFKNIEYKKIVYKVLNYNKSKIVFVPENLDNTLVYDNVIQKFEQLYKKLKIKFYTNKSKKPYSFQLPNWCYDLKYTLMDIQLDRYKKLLYFVFRDNDTGKKIIYKKTSKENYFYLGNSSFHKSDMVESIDNLTIRFDKKGVPFNIVKYEEDLSIDFKHHIDYLYNKPDEKPVKNINILFYDIEVYNDNSKEFPSPDKAAKKINSISFKYNEEQTLVYVLKMDVMDKKHYDIMDKPYVKFFDTEKELIEKFCEEVVKYNPDALSAWNGNGFDYPYIFNRMFKLNINPDILSPIGESNIDTFDIDKCTIYGLYLADQQILYKDLTDGVKESYSLSFISQDELKEDKISYDGSLDDLYEKDLGKFIEYSIQDTDLLFKLENKLKHFDLKHDLIKESGSNWKRSETTLGLVDPLVCKFAKLNNITIRNKDRTNKSEKFPGAYVIKPITGLHSWVIDLDFKSLYPSIICSLNMGTNTYIGKIESDIALYYTYQRHNLPNNITVLLDPLYSYKKEVEMTREDFIQYIEDNNYIVGITGAIFKSHDEEISFYYRLLEELSTKRDTFKFKCGELREKLFELNKNKEDNLEEILHLEFLLQRYDGVQKTVKILMNSIYGATSNAHYRLYALDISKAITATGQEVLKYIVTHLSEYMKNNNKNLNDKFLEEFEEKSPYDYIVYGDSVTKDSKIILENNEYITIEELWNNSNNDILNKNGKEIKLLNDVKVLSSNNHKNEFLKTTEIIRHKVNKKIYRVYVSNSVYVDVTEDHGIINYDKDMNYTPVKPIDCKYVLINHKVYDYDETVLLVNRIEEIEYDDYVYDLCVPETQNFYANDILVHNTDSIFVSIGDYMEL